MVSLLDVLYTCAQENLVLRMLKEEVADLKRAEREGEALMDQLEALGGEPERLVEKLRFTGDTAAFLRERGAFLAGLSVGLELGELRPAPRRETTCWPR